MRELVIKGDTKDLEILDKEGIIKFEMISPDCARYFLNPYAILDAIELAESIHMSPKNFHRNSVDKMDLALYIAVLALNENTTGKKEVIEQFRNKVIIGFVSSIIYEYFDLRPFTFRNSLKFRIKPKNYEKILRYKRRINKFNLFKAYNGIYLEQNNEVTKVGCKNGKW